MRFLLKALNAEKGEGTSIVLFLFLGISLGSSAAMVEVTALSVFVKTFDTKQLALAFMLASTVGLVTAHFYTKLQNWVPVSALAFFSLAIVWIIDVFIFYSYRIQPSNKIVYATFVFSTAFSIVLYQLFWGLFDKFFDSLQTRRLGIKIESGLVLGAILGFLAISYQINAYKIAPEYFYLEAALPMAIAGLMIIVLSINYSAVNKITSNVQYINAHNNHWSLIQKPYQRILLIFATLSGITVGLIDFSFFTIVSQKYESVADMLVYLSHFNAILLFLGYLVLLTLHTRINNKYGYMISMLLMPASLIVFALVYSVICMQKGVNPEDDSFYLLFMIMAICKLLQTVLYKGFEFNTLRSYLIPIEAELRFDFQSRLEGTFRQLGRAGAAFLAIAIIVYAGITFAWFSWMLVITVAAWAYASYKLHQWYRHTLKDSLETGDIVIKKEQKVNSFIKQLVYASPNVEARVLPVHLNILHILDPILYQKAIESLIDSQDDDVQRTALLQARDLCLLTAIPIFEQVQKSKYYPVSRNRELIYKTYHLLRGAEFRLEKIKYIEQLTFSKITSERRFGALLAAYSAEVMKPKLLTKLFRDADYKVRYNAVTAAAHAQTAELHQNLIEKLSDPLYSNAALAAIVDTGEIMFPLMESAFYLTGQEEKVQLRIVQAYGRVGTDKAVELLVRKLLYTNQNIVAASVDALSKCGKKITGEYSIQFRREIEEVCHVMVWNMYAYTILEEAGTSDLLLKAVKSEIMHNYEALFKLLSLLYDADSIALVKDNINSGNPDKTEFASELLEVFVSEELKSMLIHIISVDSYDTIVWNMQEFFPMVEMNAKEVLYDLIQRDYKWVNRWTKACALQELAQKKLFKDTDIFLANLVNPDAMLRETAAILLYQLDEKNYNIQTERFKEEYNYQSGKEIISKNILLEHNEDKPSPALKFEMIRFLNHVNEFVGISGIILLEIAKIMDYTFYKKNELIDQYESFEAFDYYFVQSGILHMKLDGKVVAEYHAGSFVHVLHYINTDTGLLQLEAQTDSVIYKIHQELFHELMSFHEEIPSVLLKQISQKETKSTLVA